MKPATVNDCDEDEKSSTYVVLIVEWCYKFSRSTAELRERPVAEIFASMGKRQTYKKLRFHPSLPFPVGRTGFSRVSLRPTVRCGLSGSEVRWREGL